MISIAIIGLGTFGCRVLEELIPTSADLIILDKDREIVEKYKKSVVNAYITDAINEETLRKIIPVNLSAAIVDLGNQLETSILVTNHLKKIGVKNIIVKAKSDEHGEILTLVGATKVIYPDLDAAIHITPMLLSPVFLNYLQISENFAIAEINVKPELEGKTLAESALRQNYGINVIGYRHDSDEEIQSASDPSMVLTSKMVLLVAGSAMSIQKYSDKKACDDLEAMVNHDKSRFGHFLRRK